MKTFTDAVVLWGGWVWCVRALALYGALTAIEQYAKMRARQDLRREIARNSGRG